MSTCERSHDSDYSAGSEMLLRIFAGEGERQ